MVSITNIASGIVMLDSMAVALMPGQVLKLNSSWLDSTIMYPELSIFLERGRISVMESAPELLTGVTDEH